MDGRRRRWRFDVRRVRDPALRNEPHAHRRLCVGNRVTEISVAAQKCRILINNAGDECKFYCEMCRPYDVLRISSKNDSRAPARVAIALHLSLKPRRLPSLPSIVCVCFLAYVALYILLYISNSTHLHSRSHAVTCLDLLPWH